MILDEMSNDLGGYNLLKNEERYALKRGEICSPNLGSMFHNSKTIIIKFGVLFCNSPVLC